MDRHQWKVSLLLGSSYLVCMWLSEGFLMHPAILFPASAIALSGLFLEGLELWPVVYFAALGGYLLGEYSLPTIILMPIAQVLQAVAGAYILRRARLDPLFRGARDTLLLIGTVAAVSLIVPTFGSLAHTVNTTFFGISSALTSWGVRYTGTVFCLLILTPFLLRWLAKSRFSRTWSEIVETVTVFVLLVGIELIIFIQGISTLAGIPTIYFLLIPLFWIALRLRPRFVTLALLITSIFAIASLYSGAAIPTPDLFEARLFQTEGFLIVLAGIFLIITSLEESRRLNSNLLRSQVATLENAVTRISSESQAKNDFIAILSHELRNPLTPIMSGIDFLKLKSDRDPSEMAMLAIMEERMHAVRRLLDDLLDIARIAEGKLTIRKGRVDLEIVMRRAILSTADRLKERHQSLVWNAPKERLLVDGDSMRIEQVFSNLLTNASKYSDSGDEITVAMRKHGTQAETVISDRGIGIDAAALEEIFTPFYQIDFGERSKKGLGIGLSLARKFVEMHNGTIAPTSKGVGLGSQFTVLLPLIQEDPTPVRQKPQGEFSPDTKTQHGPRVLIVDDIDAAAWGVGRLLEMKGCSVSYAYDGKRAIEEAANTTPDIIILDIGLPDMDGYTLARTIRARGFRGRLIALTGYGTPDARKKGEEAGFEHYLVKPAGLSDLIRVIPEIA